MEKCCYCNAMIKVADMTPVPENRTIRAIWEKKLGLVFTIRANVAIFPYICNIHLNKNEGYNVNERKTPIVSSNTFWIDTSLADHVYFNFNENEKEDSPKMEIEEEMPSTELCDTEASTSNYDPNQNYILQRFLRVANGENIDCACCYKRFKIKETSIEQLEEHLIREHNISFERTEENYDLKPAEQPSTSDNIIFSKNLSPMSSETMEQIDNYLCRFFVENGVCLEAVENPNFHKIIWNLNPNYHPPTEDGMQVVLKKIATRSKGRKIETTNPITVTVDSCSADSNLFLAFSVQYRDELENKIHMFFQRFCSKSTIISPSLIIESLQSFFGGEEHSLPVSNIVLTDATIGDELVETKTFKNAFLCTFTQLTKFADALLIMDVFKKGLYRLRSFVKAFPEDKNTWLRFKGFLIRRRAFVEYPDADVKGWYSTVDFLTKCLHMHRLFHDFTLKSKIEGYIDGEDHMRLVYLHSILRTMRTAVKQLATENATISGIIPLLLEVKNVIETSTQDMGTYRRALSKFNTCLKPLIESYDLYQHATLLDPTILFKKRSILETDRIRFKISMTSHLSMNWNESLNLQTTDKKAASFVEVEEIEMEADAYMEEVKKSDIKISAIEWWKENEKRFPKLYRLAIELLSIPALAIDASYYFGQDGKFRHMLSKMDDFEQETLLQASGELAAFKYRGEYDEKASVIRKRLNYVMKEQSEDEEEEVSDGEPPEKINEAQMNKKPTMGEAIVISNNIVRKHLLMAGKCDESKELFETAKLTKFLTRKPPYLEKNIIVPKKMDSLRNTKRENTEDSSGSWLRKKIVKTVIGKSSIVTKNVHNSPSYQPPNEPQRYPWKNVRDMRIPEQFQQKQPPAQKKYIVRIAQNRQPDRNKLLEPKQE